MDERISALVSLFAVGSGVAVIEDARLNSLLLEENSEQAVLTPLSGEAFF